MQLFRVLITLLFFVSLVASEMPEGTRSTGSPSSGRTFAIFGVQITTNSTRVWHFYRVSLKRSVVDAIYD